MKSVCGIKLFTEWKRSEACRAQYASNEGNANPTLAHVSLRIHSVRTVWLKVKITSVSTKSDGEGSP